MKRTWILIALILLILAPILGRSAVYSVKAASDPAGSGISQNSPIWTEHPVLKRVAGCESMGDANAEPRQFNSDGSILWGHDPKTGKIVQRDCGEFQINTWVHGRYPDGLDVCGSEADNQKFALILYSQSSLSPWTASGSCWATK